MREFFEDPIGVVLTVIVALVIVGIAVLIPLSIQEHNRWTEWCISQGGRIDSTTDTRVQSTVTANGQPGTTTSSHTTYYCLTVDGRILDIKG